MGIWEGEIPRRSTDVLFLWTVRGGELKRESAASSRAGSLCSLLSLPPFASAFLSSPTLVVYGQGGYSVLWSGRRGINHSLSVPWLGEISSCDSPGGCKLLKLIGLVSFSCLSFPILLALEFS